MIYGIIKGSKIKNIRGQKDQADHKSHENGGDFKIKGLPDGHGILSALCKEVR